MSDILPGAGQRDFSLEEAYELLEIIFTKSTDILVLVESYSKKLVYFNNQAAKYFTWCRSNAFFNMRSILISAQNWKGLLTFEDLLLIPEGEDEVYFFLPSGKYFWGEVAISRVVFKQQLFQIIRIKDITSKVEINKHLELLQAAIDNAYDSVVITDGLLDYPHPKIIYVNPAFCRMTGYTPEEVIGKTPRILQGPKTSRKKLDRLRQVLAQGKFFSMSTTNYKKNGTPYVVEWHISPIFNEKKEITHWVSVQRDITEKIKAKKLLLKNKKRAEYSRLLTVIRTQEEEKAHFAFMLHEELGPLLSLLGMHLSMFEEKIKGLGTNFEFWGHLLTAQKILQKSIQEIRNISWHLMPIALEDFGLLNALGNLCQKMQKKKNIPIYFKCYATEPEIKKITKINIYRIVQELVENAVVHSQSTHILVGVRQIDNFLQIMIKDNGIGFDTKNIRKGYGLKNVQTRLKIMHGSFYLKSSINKGCKVRVKIPLNTLP
ncbi:MAG: PAS domain S-box protein [Bacteroidia bacterium]|nr:PAS domain S-box protein [Bacteroidia bacterium]MDW8159287.1 PAS domain S-box protein [Bacteroidia bacterium]